jgi:hypothetical protein
MQTAENYVLIVKLQIPASSIPLIAKRTMVMLLSTVAPHVFIQPRLADEAFTACLTQMWSFTCA